MLNNVATAALMPAAADGKGLVDDVCAKKAVTELTRTWRQPATSKSVRRRSVITVTDRRCFASAHSLAESSSENGAEPSSSSSAGNTRWAP